MDGQKVQFQRSVSSISQQNIESFSPKELGRIACGASSFWVVPKELVLDPSPAIPTTLSIKTQHNSLIFGTQHKDTHHNITQY